MHALETLAAAAIALVLLGVPTILALSAVLEVLSKRNSRPRRPAP